MDNLVVAISITLEKRDGDWRAYLTEKPEWFFIGVSPSDAMDRLIAELDLE